MTWNHRVFNEPTPEGDWLTIREVYYDGDVPKGYTADPIDPSGETLEELGLVLEQMKEALCKPVLTEQDFRSQE